MARKSWSLIFYPATIFIALTLLGFVGSLYITFQQKQLSQESFLAAARSKTANMMAQLAINNQNKNTSNDFAIQEFLVAQVNHEYNHDLRGYIIGQAPHSSITYDLNSGKALSKRDQRDLFFQRPSLHYNERIFIGKKPWDLLIIPAPNNFTTNPTIAIFLQSVAVLIGTLLAFILRQSLIRTCQLRKDIYQRITEMKEYLHIKEQAQENNKLLNIVMDSFPHGICAFSPDMTLLKWNNNLLTILNIPPEAVKKGMLYKVLTKHLDLISYQLSVKNTVPLRPHHVIEDSYLKQDISYFERNLEDGRTLEVSLSPMPSGGFIVIYSDITERKKAERVIRHMAHFDSLTGLANRAHFSNKLEGLLNHKRQGDDRLALALIDLDKFKDVNDTYGHPMGDTLLQRIAEILTSQIRDHDFAARIGGDEFVIIFTNINEANEVLIPLNRMIKQITKPIMIRGTPLEIGASIGVAFYPEHGSTSKELTKFADEALYKVKANGRGNIKIAPHKTWPSPMAINMVMA